MAARWWIEKEDGSGYLLPIGATVEEISSISQKNALQPTWQGDNPPIMFVLAGVAGNTNATPTTAQVTAAMTAFQSFAVTNDKITKVKLLSHDGTNPMGAELGSVPGSTSEEYESCYTDKGWEILKFDLRDIVFPNNFSFELRISNLFISAPGGGSEKNDIGDLVSANAVSSRSIANGIQTDEITLNMTLMDRDQQSKAISAVVILAGLEQSVVLKNIMRRNDDAGDDAQAVAVNNNAFGGQLDLMTYAYDPVTLNFTCRVVASRPSVSRSSDFVSARGVSVVGSVDYDEGIVSARRKGAGNRSGGRNSPGRGRQRSYQPEITIEVAISITGFVGTEMNFPAMVKAILAPMELAGFFADGGERYGQSSGSITADGRESGIIRTARLTYTGEEPYSGHRTDTKKPSSMKSRALAALAQCNLNAVLAGVATGPAAAKLNTKDFD